MGQVLAEIFVCLFCKKKILKRENIQSLPFNYNSMTPKVYFLKISPKITMNRVSEWQESGQSIKSYSHQAKHFCENVLIQFNMMISNWDQRVGTCCHRPIPTPVPYRTENSHLVAAAVFDTNYKIHDVTCPPRCIPHHNNLSTRNTRCLACRLHRVIWDKQPILLIWICERPCTDGAVRVECKLLECL